MYNICYIVELVIIILFLFVGVFAEDIHKNLIALYILKVSCHISYLPDDQQKEIKH